MPPTSTGSPGPVGGLCNNLDAYECSRHVNCIATYLARAASLHRNHCRRSARTSRYLAEMLKRRDGNATAAAKAARPELLLSPAESPRFVPCHSAEVRLPT